VCDYQELQDQFYQFSGSRIKISFLRYL